MSIPVPRQTVSDFNAIPADMRARPHWVVWRQEIPTGKTKPTKVPYIAGLTDKGASSTNPNTWRAFEVARRAYLAGGYDGLGYMFEDDYVFVDVDHCFDAAGNLSERGRALVDEFGTYAERSPNDGLHLFMRGKLAGDWHRRGDVEIYWAERFSTITGNHIAGTPASPQTVNGPLDRLYASIAPPVSTKQRAVESTAGQFVPLSDTEVLEKAGKSRNGIKFQDLMGGDLFGYEGDHSAADLALCGLLAFWCHNDTTQMDRIFRTSKLMRPKWDDRRGRSTYGQDTLDKARGANVYENVSDAQRAVESTAGAVTQGSCLATPDSLPVGSRTDESTAGQLASQIDILLLKVETLTTDNLRLAEALSLAHSRTSELLAIVAALQVQADASVANETADCAIAMLEDRVSDLEQEKLEILALARDTALSPTDRVTGIIFKEAGQAYRKRLVLGVAPLPEQEKRVSVAALEEEIGLAKGTAARYLKPVIARGHVKYRVIPDEDSRNHGPPRSIALIAPGDAQLRSVVDLRRQRMREQKETERAAKARELERTRARVAELEAAAERAAKGCPMCGEPLLATGYHCAGCHKNHSTGDVAAAPAEPYNLRPITRSIYTDNSRDQYDHDLWKPLGPSHVE